MTETFFINIRINIKMNQLILSFEIRDNQLSDFSTILEIRDKESFINRYFIN